jgi:hypothetical protein
LSFARQKIWAMTFHDPALLEPIVGALLCSFLDCIADFAAALAASAASTKYYALPG